MSDDVRDKIDPLRKEILLQAMITELALPANAAIEDSDGSVCTIGLALRCRGYQKGTMQNARTKLLYNEAAEWLGISREDVNDIWQANDDRINDGTINLDNERGWAPMIKWLKGEG